MMLSRYHPRLPGINAVCHPYHDGSRRDSIANRLFLTSAGSWWHRLPVSIWLARRHSGPGAPESLQGRLRGRSNRIRDSDQHRLMPLRPLARTISAASVSSRSVMKRSSGPALAACSGAQAQGRPRTDHRMTRAGSMPLAGAPAVAAVASSYHTRRARAVAVVRTSSASGGRIDGHRAGHPSRPCVMPQPRSQDDEQDQGRGTANRDAETQGERLVP